MTKDFTSDLLREAQRTHARPMWKFAQDEIIIPSGPMIGHFYSLDKQPYTRLWFDCVADGKYNRRAAVGPTQTGKTLTCSSIPVLYHLFELREDVIYGVPTLEMAGDKWRRDILPVIEASRYADMMPRRGRGSRAGTVTSIQFNNGATLKFMPAGGSDKVRAGYTGRVLTITETDGFDEASGISREADKVTQMEARLRAHGKHKSVYLECTASIEDGRIWQEYTAGTYSKIMLPCPYCDALVAPEREHFRGWQDAANEMEARAFGCFHCPLCDHAWTDEDRVQANKHCTIQHTNDSSTFGFRWSAVHNMFVDQGDIAFDEWKSARRVDRDNAEREMCQFVWAIPYKPLPPPDYITVETLSKAVKGYMRGTVPEWADVLTVGVDCHKFTHYWVLAAWRKDGTGHIVDYGMTDCPTNEYGAERGMRIGLDTMHDFMTQGFPVEGSNTRKVRDLGCVDAGYMSEVVVNFCRAVGNYWPCIGEGHTKEGYGSIIKRVYSAPRTRGRTIPEIGEHWHTVTNGNVLTLHHNVDWEKLWIHQRLQIPDGEPGALTLFTVSHDKEHLKFLSQLASEQLITENGETKWLQTSTNNHFLDALCLSWTAARKLNVASVTDKIQQTITRTRKPTGEAIAEALSRKMRRY